MTANQPANVMLGDHPPESWEQIIRAGGVPARAPWRVGRRVPRNLYVGRETCEGCAGPGPHELTESDCSHSRGVDVGRMDTPALAAYVVEAVNARAAHESDDARQRFDALVEQLCALIPEDEGDDVAVEAIIVRWVTASVAERDDARAALREIAAKLPEVAALAGHDTDAGFAALGYAEVARRALGEDA